MDVVSFRNWKLLQRTLGKRGCTGFPAFSPFLWKRLSFLCFLIGFCPPLFPQQGFHIGGAAGFHNSWLVNQKDSDKERLLRRFTPGGNGGFLLRYYIESQIAIGFDVLYSFQGQRYLWDGKIKDVRRATRLLYLKTPLLLELRRNIGRGGDVYFKGHFGAYMSSVQAAFRRREGESLETPGEREWVEAYRTPVFGVILGLGPGIRWGRGWGSTLQLRFDHDFTNAEEKTSDLIRNTRPATYNATLGVQITLRYAFQEQASRKNSYL